MKHFEYINIAGRMLSAIFFSGFFITAIAQESTEKIRLNQIGFYPDAPKIAILAENKSGKFYITTPDLKDTVFTGILSEPHTNTISGKITRWADFSALQKKGTFVVAIPETGKSYPFEIKTGVFKELAKGAMKSYYFQRASIDLPEKYAGIWKRAAGHPDDHILVHNSASSDDRPVGSVIFGARGWYDAGDYNKYIVNSGITMGTLLSAYEDYQGYVKKMNLTIPESNNKIPDLLDEAIWNLRWMLTMQDPYDGGVYHKLTNSSFDSMIMPAKATKDRFVVQKNTIATLDFAAVMAQASRIFRNHKAELPGLADSCLAAAQKAWLWTEKNPDVWYRQNEMNKKYDPDVVTGGYEDRDAKDEFIWAATELYLATKNEKYYQSVAIFPDKNTPLPSWNQVRTLAYYSLARFEKQLTPIARKDIPILKEHLTEFAENLMSGIENQAYQTVMGKTAKDYIWGSSSVAANQGIALIQAYKLTNNKKYLYGALSNLDYLLGRNATGYSFVTGFGDKTPMHPHHRPSEADGIELPVPGLLSGGPNPGKQDKCEGYPSDFADECFLDNVCSYASNEIAINWNAPLVYLTIAIEASFKK
jgi:endoglucanase